MGMIELRGTLSCAPEETEIVQTALPEHIRLTREEPGCLTFEVTQTGPCTFTVFEQFRDQAAFDAHQSRTKASDWFRATGHMPRDFHLRTVSEKESPTA